VGPGVNPFGDEALALLEDWSRKGPCVDPDDPEAPVEKKLFHGATKKAGS
jgi:hypothetical protein